MKGVQCYELFGGIALKIHTFSFFLNYMLTSFLLYFFFLDIFYERAMSSPEK